MTDIEKLIKSIPFAEGCFVAKWHPCGLIAIDKKAGRMSHPNQKDALKGRSPMIRAHYNYKEEYFSWNFREENEEVKEEGALATDSSSEASAVELAPENKQLPVRESPASLDEENAQKGGAERVRLYLINRLDSPTSGVVLASFNPEVAELAKAAFKERDVEKTYYAVCIGRPFQHAGTLSDRLMKKSGAGFVRAAVSARGVSVMTDYSVEQNDANGAGLALIKLTPRTGFTHQLRVQCAQRKFPILGDASYGNFPINKNFKRWTKINRLFLHCASTSIEFDYEGEHIKFDGEVPLPQSFDSVIKYNFAIAKNFNDKPRA